MYVVLFEVAGSGSTSGEKVHDYCNVLPGGVHHSLSFRDVLLLAVVLLEGTDLTSDSFAASTICGWILRKYMNRSRFVTTDGQI